MNDCIIERLMDNWSTIKDEYDQLSVRSIALRDFSATPSYTPEWRAITLWWNYKPLAPFQKRMPKTTELVREGPTHRATGWLLLNPHSRTPEHNHKDWGHKIIVHIPTYIPEGDCGFVVEGKVHRWEVGKPLAFDCHQSHYGFNNTDEQRSIMVLDFDYDTHYEQLKKYMNYER